MHNRTIYIILVQRYHFVQHMEEPSVTKFNTNVSYFQYIDCYKTPQWCILAMVMDTPQLLI